MNEAPLKVSRAGFTFTALPAALKLLAITAIAILATPVHADVGDAYGFGARNNALAAASVAWGFDPYAAYHNPALLATARSTTPDALDDPHAEKRRLGFTMGLLYMQPTFKDITGVTVQNDFSSDTNKSGSVDTDYRPAFGLLLGASYRVFEEIGKGPVAGVTLFLPLQATAYIDSGETYQPEYSLYRSRFQRPQVEIGVGQSLGDFQIGVGTHIGYTLTTNATVFLQGTSTPPGSSTLRFTSSLRPKLSFFAGVSYVPEALEKDLTIGLVGRIPTQSDSYNTLRTTSEVFGGLSALEFAFRATSTLYYDPGELQLGASKHLARFEGGALRGFAQIDYQWWTLYRSPALKLDNSAGSCTTCSGVVISPTYEPNLPLRNILIPRGALELTMGRNQYRAGYAYRPSIFSEVPSGAGNLLDPSKHMFNAGFGRQFKSLLTIETPVTFDIAFGLQYLVPQTIKKTAGDELGANAGTATKLGAPGYEAAGWVYGGGVSLTLLL